MCQDSHGSHKVPTIEGQDNVKEAGSCFWVGRNNDTPLDEAPPKVAWLLSLYMEPYHLPKQILYGELGKKRSRHDTKRRWQDVVTANIKVVGVSEDWYGKGQTGMASPMSVQDFISCSATQSGLVFKGWTH